MASPIDSQEPWLPYEDSKDCSLGFCTPYCLQWCYIVFPPPPPLKALSDDSHTTFSPLVIAIIGILASVFVVAIYFAVVSRYCGGFHSLRRQSRSSSPNEGFDEVGGPPPPDEAWHIATVGLDEAIIKSIAVCRYRQGDGLVDGTDCSVCLNEFQEDERLRLLPKCSHAFHLHCIDTWLKSHSNCPLCRASIVSTSPSTPQLPAPAAEGLSNNRLSTESQSPEIVLPVEDLERNREEMSLSGDAVSKAPLRAFSDLGRLEDRNYEIVEIGEKERRAMKRSFSMDSVSQSSVSIAELLARSSSENGNEEKGLRIPAYFQHLKRFRSERSKSTDRRGGGVLHSATSPISMKRSSSSGRLLFSRYGRGRNAILPL
ncbi:hypothetical protein ACLOJK_030511 [Asimina triloba]